MLALVLADAFLWILAAWYGGSWITGKDIHLIPASKISIAMLLLLGVAPFVLAVVGGMKDALFLISGAVFLLAAAFVLVQSAGAAPGIVPARGASVKERFITTVGLAAVLTAITLVR